MRIEIDLSGYPPTDTPELQCADILQDIARGLSAWGMPTDGGSRRQLPDFDGDLIEGAWVNP